MLSLSKVESKKKSEALQITFILLLIAALKSFLIEHYLVPSGSMLPNIVPGDIILATKYDYGYSGNSLWPVRLDSSRVVFASEPKRGEIIIIRDRSHGLTGRIFGTRLIKRLVGLPGDKLQFINGMLFINDVAADKELLGVEGTEAEYEEKLPGGTRYVVLENGLGSSNSEVFHVPNGQYFFLGDNRGNSADSRGSLGYVPRECLVAKAKYVLLRTNKSINPLKWCLKKSLTKLECKVN